MSLGTNLSYGADGRKVGESRNGEELKRTDIRSADQEKTRVHYVKNMMTKNLDNGDTGVGVGWSGCGEPTVLVTRKEFYPKVLFFLTLLTLLYFPNVKFHELVANL